MEERRVARGLMQRQLEVAPDESAPPPCADPPTVPETDASTTPPPAPRAPSGDSLRERQERWLEERARFEASPRLRRPPDAETR